MVSYMNRQSHARWNENPSRSALTGAVAPGTAPDTELGIAPGAASSAAPGAEGSASCSYCWFMRTSPLHRPAP